MQIRGILFDKDGTLIDFNSIWVPPSKKIIADVLVKNHLFSYGLERVFLEHIGVVNDEAVPNGLLAKGTLKEIAHVIVRLLRSYLPEQNRDWDKLEDKIVEKYNSLVNYSVLAAEDHRRMEQFIIDLKVMQLDLGIASQDEYYKVQEFAHAFHIDSYMSYMGGAGNAAELKPEPYMAYKFAKTTHIPLDEIAIVGDLVQDMEFAKKSGCIAIGVLSGLSTRYQLEKYADYIINSIYDLPNVIEKAREI